MENKCGECGASIKSSQAQCVYCGSEQGNANERLLIELTAVKRKFELARVRGNKLEMDSLLADEYVYTLTDAGSETQIDKKGLLENDFIDKNFLSYSIGSEELLDRTDKTAAVACIQTIVRRTPFSNYDPYIERSKIKFVRREGRWQIAAEKSVSIDENGEEIQ